MKGIISAWGKILTGHQPNLSIEILLSARSPARDAMRTAAITWVATSRFVRFVTSKAQSSSPPCLHC